MSTMSFRPRYLQNKSTTFTSHPPRSNLKPLTPARSLNPASVKVDSFSSKHSSDKTLQQGVARKTYQKTLCAWKLEGNVDIPFICDLGVDRKCPNFSKKCPYLHANTSYYWQFTNSWKNFHKFHSDILERNFRDVNCDQVTLPELKRGKLLDTFKNKSEVNFTSMTIIIDNSVFPIRRLTTPVFSENSPVFIWYFKNDLDKWQMFGNSTKASLLIDKHYQQFKDNKGSSVILANSNSFKYEINFSLMQQRNLTTNKRRIMKRRPEPFQNVELGAINKNLPREWNTMSQEQKYITVNLDYLKSEYQEIESSILRSFPTAANYVVLRLQNPYIWSQFKNKESELKMIYKSRSLDIQKLFFPIQSKDLDDICKNNIDWRVHSSHSSKLYGQGSYFYKRFVLL